MDEGAQYSSTAAGLNPLAVALLLAGALVLLGSSRKNGLKAFLAVAMMVPMGQQIMVGGFHFMFFRILIAVGLFRAVVRGDYSTFKMNKVDKLFIAWALIEVVCGVIRGFQAVQLGIAYDVLGVYFLVRFLTKEPEDVMGPLRFLCLLTLIVAAVMCFEAATHHNPFSVMGGVPLVDEIRNGKARAQGPFHGNLPAGIFGSTMFPLMVGLWLQGGKNRRPAIAGIIGSVIITITSVSSGALLTIMAACAGLGLWRARDRMRILRRCAVILLIALNMVMKVPVYWLIARFSDLVGGGGWYRSFIIDACVNHFRRWWLTGDDATINWCPGMFSQAVDPNNLDITNYYVAQCVMGGIWMLAVFIAIITCCYQIVGRLVHTDENLVWKRTFIWTFGVSLAAYCTTFFSMNISDQSSVFWHWLVAVVAGLPAYAVSQEGSEVPQAEAAPGDLVMQADTGPHAF